VVYLYSCDLKKLYLTMGLGSYQFAKIYSENNFALSKMQEAASKLIKSSYSLKTRYLEVSEKSRLIEGPIDLYPYKTGYSAHKAYGSSSIYSISYDLNDLPEDEFLVEDYLDFINFYKKLVYDPAIPSVEELLLSNDETNISEASLEVIDFIPRKPPKKRAKSQGSDSKSSNQQRRSKDAFVTGKIGEEIVFNYEKEQLGKTNSDYEVIWCRNDPKDRTPGYDILSFDKEGNKKYIEVKSAKESKISSVNLTAHEWEVAQDEKYKDNYYLYLVTNVLSNNVKIEVIKNPARMTSENKFHIVVSDYKLFFHTDL
jgi:CRISPR/Cas system-associated exonuclease Cas4 (RecB family)